MENRIRELRKERGISQEELAKLCHVSRQTVNAIENNKYDPTLALAYCLAFLIYQMGAWLYAEASFGIGQGLAVLLLLGLIYLVVKKPSASSK